MTDTLVVTQRLYRLDTFVVPRIARDDFCARVKSIHEVLRAQPGFIQDFLLEKPLSDEALTLVTLVEWKDATSLDNARAAVVAMHNRTGFNAQDTMARLGIKAEIGNYKSINA